MTFRICVAPSNEDDFELFCLRLLRRRWACPTLALYGKRGERQDGVDIIDELGSIPLRGIQCKHKEFDKTLPPEEIKEEVEKALRFRPKLAEYFILTSGRQSAQAQSAVIEINQQHAAQGLFRVHVWPWERIQQEISELEDAAYDYVVYGGTGRSAPQLASMITTVLERTGVLNAADANYNDRELTAIEEEIARHRRDSAKERLLTLQTQAIIPLSHPQWYRAKRLQAQICIEQWHWSEAGRLLLDALQHDSASMRSTINEALAYELLDDPSTAHDKAAAQRSLYPLESKPVAIWIRTAKLDTPFEVLSAAAATIPEPNEELTLAITIAALQRNLLDEAMQYATTGIDAWPDSAHAWYLLGQAQHRRAFTSRDANRNDAFRATVDSYDRAAALAKRDQLHSLEASIRRSRGAARVSLGDHRADSDFAAAVELDPTDIQNRVQYISHLVDDSRYEAAVTELAQYSSVSDDFLRQLEAMARWGRNRGDDRSLALAILYELISRPDSPRWLDAHVVLAQSAAETSLTTESRAAIWSPDLRARSAFVSDLLTGWMLAASGAIPDAKELLLAANAAVEKAPSSNYVQLLAQALQKAECFAEALALLETVYRPGLFDSDCRRLLDLASKTHRHDVITRVCRELRHAGITDSQVVHTEIRFLQMYDAVGAMKIAEDRLTQHPDDRVTGLWRSVIALRLGLNDQIVADLERLPKPAELTIDGAGLVLWLLRYTHQYEACLDYAYHALREHFEDPKSHVVYIAYFNRVSAKIPKLTSPKRVQAGCAVCIREIDADAAQWVVIEDGANSEVQRSEYPPSHAVSIALFDKAVGDVAALNETGIQPREAEIAAILSKYVFRYKDCIQQFQLRFDGQSSVQLFRTGRGDEFDPTPIVEQLSDRRKYVEMLLEEYKSGLMPLHMLGELTGTDELAAWEYVVSDASLGIRSAPGEPQALGAAVTSVKSCSELVLDVMTLITIGQAGLADCLTDVPFRMVIAQSAVDHLTAMIEVVEGLQHSGAIAVGTPDGRVQIREVTVEERESRVAFLVSVREFARQRCEILPCPRTAELAPDRRLQLIEATGRATLDAMILASEGDRLLWCEERVLAIVAETEFRVRSVWGQAVLIALWDSGSIGAEALDQASARFVGWHYQGIRFQDSTLVAAAELADWEMTKWPAIQVLEAVETSTSTVNIKVGICASAIRSVWRSEVGDSERIRFVNAILDILRSQSAIARLRRRIREQFLIDVSGELEIQTLIDVWLGSTRRILLP